MNLEPTGVSVKPGYQNVSGKCEASKCQPCSHLCATNNTTGGNRCLCPRDMELAHDGFTCVVSPYPHGNAARDTFLETGKTKTTSVDVSISDPIEFSFVVSLQKESLTHAYVQSNGVIIFYEESRLQTEQNTIYIGQKNRKAPLWQNSKAAVNVSYNLYESCSASDFFEPASQSKMSPKAREIMERAKRDCEEIYGIANISVSLVLVATWNQDCQNKDYNTFQIVFVSGRYTETGKKDVAGSFMFFIYKEGGVECLLSQFFHVVTKINITEWSDQLSQSSRTTVGSTDYLGLVTNKLGKNISMSHLCQDYVCKHSSLIASPYFQAELSQLFQCPCSTDKLGIQWEKLYSPKRSNTTCFSIRPLIKGRLWQNNQRNIRCCYKSPANTDIKTTGQLYSTIAGSFDSVSHYLICDPIQSGSSLLTHDADQNIQTQNHCCNKSTGKYCNRFTKIFHSLQCTPFPIFFIAFAFGDPSILTLDGFKYPMNGIGEYVMINSENFTLQARTSRIDINGTPSNGTVFTAFAAKESNDSWFQVQLATTNTSMVIMAQGMDFTGKFYSDVNFDLSEDNLIVRRLNENNKIVAAVSFPCGVSFKVRVGDRSLEADFEVHNSLQNKTRGLLGNFNNDSSDDFLLPNGTILSHNMTERQIFYNFARSYLVTRFNSAFLYNKGETTDDYQISSFVPLFLDEIEPSKLNDAKEFCGSNNTACLYDYVAAGPTFARNTRDTQRAVDLKLQIFANRPPTVRLLTGLAANSYLLVTEGQRSSLQLRASDEDGDPITYELIENVPGVVLYPNGTLSYTATLDPSSIEVVVKDSKNAYSPLLRIVTAVCPFCYNRGLCDSEHVDEQIMVGTHKTLKCSCPPAYTGIRCETELDACLLHPCSDGQNCTDLTAAQQGNNRIGYVCGPCPSGTVDLYGSCVDINECLNRSLNDCDQGCQNTDQSYVCFCRHGFRLSTEDGRTCIDINECEERTSLCQQKCVNTRGKYKCDCYDGYTLASDGLNCRINDNITSACKECHQVCEVLDNEVTCGCYIGFTIDDNNVNGCIDIDECNSGGNSPCSQKCVNTLGRFNCSCYHGYKLDPDGVTCEECESGKYGENCSGTCNCLGRGLCDKVRGCVCDPSWTGTNCDKDVNECSNSSACPGGLVCQNEPGSFRCVCQDGYKLENEFCSDINECNDVNNKCDSKLEFCENNVGNYTCRCKEGFSRSRYSGICEDINECEQHIDGCEHICENGPGSYRCVCHQGYRLAEDQRKCEKYKTVCDLDCSHGCSFDDNGQPVCICPGGYIRVGTGICYDVNECGQKDRNFCSEKSLCQNLAGNYLCSCSPGYRLENDNRTCMACSGGTWGPGCSESCSCGKGTIRCDPVSGCVCKPGYTGIRCSETIKTTKKCEPSCKATEECVIESGISVCQCLKGFVWSAGTCVDKNECNNVRQHSCDQKCTNTVGSYTCDCYNGYIYNSSTNTCQDINECTRGHDCNQVCINTAGGYRCSCALGQFLLDDGLRCEPCINGSCMSCTCHEKNTVSCNTTTGQCVCQPSWTSDDCSLDVDECLTNPCPGNKECLNQAGSFHCKEKNISKSASGFTELNTFFLFLNIFLSYRISSF